VGKLIEIVGMHAAEEIQGLRQPTPRQCEGDRECVRARSTRVQFARRDEREKAAASSDYRA
jgi:hypothetical protein